MTHSDLFDYSTTKSDRYFTGARNDYVSVLPDSSIANILEIGCGDGSTGAAALAAGKCGRYVGIEIAEGPAARARACLSDVRLGNVEVMDITDPPETYDAVIASEVLEHLTDPWDVVRRLAALLKPGGLFLASSPNVAHHRIVRDLVRGRWRLADSGPMDRTHLRWFTPESYRRMFEEAGLDVIHSAGVAPLGPRARVLSRLTGGRINHLFYTQNNIHARKPLSSRQG